MTKEEFDSLKECDTVWLALPQLSMPVRGKLVYACLLDISSKAEYGVTAKKGNLWFKWAPRTDSEFRKHVFRTREDVSDLTESN